ncbi:putative glycolipid-binding domain-containing protein [Ensifer soli]|uniref:putative glycolipid-binding domain-containing protein n=1 Tax=Ciceribacter sp. sgz301302 TaxID=3342379 RepID=UPI0035BB6C04
MFRPLRPTEARWRAHDGQGLEHLTIRPFEFGFGAGLRAEAVVIGAGEGRGFSCRYRIDCDERWQVRAVTVERTDGLVLDLFTDGEGRWWTTRGEDLPAFDGCLDIDLSATPFTNTLPIRRLNLAAASGRADLAMLYIPLDTLQPHCHGQRYTALQDGRLYRFEVADGSFSADLPVDADGLVTDYPTLFSRL